MSFTGAARELNVTPAAVSQHVRQLEDWLGAPLFNRQPRSLTLTDSGLGYLPVVRSAFDYLAAGTEDLFGEGRGGPITAHVTISLTAQWLAPRLPRFVAAHPDITLRLMTGLDTVAVGSGGVDVEIRYGSGDWPGLRTARLFDEELFPVCSPALLEGPEPLAAPQDLCRFPMIHVIGEPENWQMWLRAAGVSGMAVGGGLQFDLHMMATHAAIAGAGVALGLSPMVDDALADGRLVAPFATRIPARDAHYVVTTEEAIGRAEVQAFVNWLIAEARGDG